MAGNPFKPVARGDRATFARDWVNAVTSAAQKNKQSRLPSVNDPSLLRHPEGLILVKNSNVDPGIQRFQVLGIDSVLVPAATNLTEFQNNPALVGVTPTVAAHTGLFVITAEAIPKGAIGRAFLFGYAVVQVFMNGATDPSADVKDGDTTQLMSGASGAAQIIKSAGGTGTQWCLVRFGGLGGSETKGQYEGMAHVIVAQNSDGWAFIEAHALP